MNLKELNEAIKAECKNYNIGGERTAFLDGADFVIGLLSLSIGGSKNNSLIKLQSELKDTLFVRPCDIDKLESAAIRLCDAIIELNEQ